MSSFNKPPPYHPKIEVDGHDYFPAPYTQAPLPPIIRNGLIPVGLLAIASVLTTTALIAFIVYRLIRWKRHYRSFLGYNQYVLLVLNLLLADLQQSAAYLVSFHWIRKDAILAPSAPCFAQGWLLHSGDVSSGFFVLAIAVHTYYTAVAGKRLSHRIFTIIVICIWLLAYFLTAVGVIMHRDKYFTRAGAWCWVSAAFEIDRLALHYVWVFFVQFATVVIYIIIFIRLRRKTSRLFEGLRLSQESNAHVRTVRAVNRVTLLMTLYPCVYVVLTLPLSAGRMWSMAHGGAAYSDEYALVAGSLLTSCGWVDSLLYSLTRKRLLQDTMPEGSGSSARPSDSAATAVGSSNRNESMDKDSAWRSVRRTRTVTVEKHGSSDLGTLSDFSKSRAASSTLCNSTRQDSFVPAKFGSIAEVGVGGGRQDSDVECRDGAIELREMLNSEPSERIV